MQFPGVTSFKLPVLTMYDAGPFAHARIMLAVIGNILHFSLLIHSVMSHIIGFRRGPKPPLGPRLSAAYMILAP